MELLLEPLFDVFCWKPELMIACMYAGAVLARLHKGV